MGTILSSIERYINYRAYNYALMINGEWGCGKTYFIKHEVIPHVRKMGKAVFYLSLYGINSTDEIGQMLEYQFIKDKFSNKRDPDKEKYSGFSRVTGAVSASLIRYGIKKIESEERGLDDVFDAVFNYDSKVIIFDDLERSGCEINLVLGYINTFTEHTDASIILVANEHEIGKWQLNRSPELQMMIAMDSRIDVDIPKTMKKTIAAIGSNSNFDSQNETFSPGEIEKRRQAIFHSNTSYLKMKEKVVGLTINYLPDLRDVYKKLIENRFQIDESSMKLMLGMVDEFVELANKDDHRNIRSFLFFIEKARDILNAFEMDYQDIYPIILRYTYRSSIRYMQGKDMPDWDADYGEQKFNDDEFSFMTSDSMIGFKFIDDMIVSNVYDKEYINDVLRRYDSKCKQTGRLSNDAFQCIQTWWESEDEEVSEWLDEIEYKVASGFYSLDLFPRLVRNLVDIKTNSVMVEKCDSIFETMYKRVREYKDYEEPSVFWDEHFNMDGKMREEYILVRQKLDKLMGEKKEKLEKNQCIDAIKDLNCWGTNLYNLSEDYGGVINGHSFMYWIDPDEIADLITKSANEEIYKFSCSIDKIYGRRVYYERKLDDLDNLKRLKDTIKGFDIEINGEIKKYHIKWILSELDKYIDSMSVTGIDYEGVVDN